MKINLETPKRTFEDRCCFLLHKTKDGNDMTQHELLALTNAVNGFTDWSNMEQIFEKYGVL